MREEEVIIYTLRQSRNVGMLLLLVTSPLLQAQTASLLDEQLVCFMNNWIGIDEAGTQIDYDIYGSDDELSPENFFYLDLVTMEATYFWSNRKTMVKATF